LRSSSKREFLKSTHAARLFSSGKQANARAFLSFPLFARNAPISLNPAKFFCRPFY
jgi:hypothetical protein